MCVCCRCVFCSVCVCVCVLPVPPCRSSEASSQPPPCPEKSTGLCRRSRSSLLHSSRRRAGPHALSAQTTSRGTTWHTDSRAHRHTHTHSPGKSAGSTNRRCPEGGKKKVVRNQPGRVKGKKWREAECFPPASRVGVWMLSVSRTDCQREEARKCWKEREKFAPCELGKKKSRSPLCHC